MINIKKANWKSNLKIFGEMNITTTVLEQNGVYFNPKDDAFLYCIFKEYASKHLDKKEITLSLSNKDISFYAKNSNIYLLNYIYSDLFPNRELKAYETVIECAEDGDINLPLFSVDNQQIIRFVEMLEMMNINFQDLSDKYLIDTFPKSQTTCKKEIIGEVTYTNVDKKTPIKG